MLKLFFEKVKTKIQIGGGDPNGNPRNGRYFIEQTSPSHKRAEFIRIIKRKLEGSNERSQILENYKKKANSRQSKIGQKDIIQSKIFEQAIKKLEDTTEHVDLELKQKDNEIELLENKIGLPESEVIEQMNRLGVKKNIF